MVVFTPYNINYEERFLEGRKIRRKTQKPSRILEKFDNCLNAVGQFHAIILIERSVSVRCFDTCKGRMG
jgi:hypothetical protein